MDEDDEDFEDLEDEDEEAFDEEVDVPPYSMSATAR
jgi:hypothetical protein